MTWYQYKTAGYCIGFSLLVFVFAGCSKMDATYRDFWKNGEKTYPEAADSLKVYPGKNRIQFSWLIVGDPTVVKAKIFWNNGKDSVEKPVTRHGQSADTVSVMLTEMPEGAYSFNIYTYDDKGNSSVGISTIGKVYGDNYINSLLIRLENSAVFANDTLKIAWGDPVNETSIGTEVNYIDTNGETHIAYVSQDTDSSVIADYDYDASKGVFLYRTMYLPDSLAIDTFYTAYDTVKVIGPPQEYDKTGWSAEASDQRAANPADNIIDNDPNTIWIAGQKNAFPHTLTVDMGKVPGPIAGFSLIQRIGNVDPHLNSFEFQVSTDGSEWQSMGRFVAADITDLQRFDIPEVQGIRYFRLICYSPYRDTPLLSLAEVGVYHR
jgi:hypothetical protein